jgi:hypothetical protein
MARQIRKERVFAGFADMYTAPRDTARPPDTVGYNGDFGADYKSVGATDEGVTINFGVETKEHTIEEDPLPAFRVITSAAFTFTAGLAEDTIENMQLAYGVGQIVQVGQKKELRLSTSLNELTIFLEAEVPGGMVRRMHVPGVMSGAEVETPYRRAESKRIYPVTFTTVCALEDIGIYEIPKAGIPAGA